MKVKPFVKWAGGKGSLIPQLRNYYPLELENGIIETYIEPFVGSGAVLIDALQNYQIKKAYAFDINEELINCYNVIKTEVNKLIKLLSKLEKEYLLLDAEGRKDFYYNKRDEYNSYRLQKNEISIKKASEFIFLNRTCFNGLYRVNRSGDFNVPMGNYRNPTICDGENLKELSKLLKNVEFKCEDYAESLKYADENTFIYFDPPYRPLNITSSFTSYTKDDFNDEDQKGLGKFYKELDNRNSKLMLSNSNPKNTNKADTFFEDIYKEFNINEVYAKRMINSDSSNRGAISELVITNYETEISQCSIFSYIPESNILKQAIPV